MKIIAATDSHYDRAALIQLTEEIRRRGDIDAVIHTGDMVGDAQWLRRSLTIPVWSVPGNCDMLSGEPSEQLVELDGVRTLICHGHTLRVKYTLDPLVYRAMELGASLTVYGHTHARLCRLESGVLLLNPGALKDGRYALVEIRQGVIQPPALLSL